MILSPETIGWLGNRALDLLRLLPELAPPTANISGSSWVGSWTFHDFLNPFPLISRIVSWFLKFLRSVCFLFNSSACYLDTIKAIFAKSHPLWSRAVSLNMHLPLSTPLCSLQHLSLPIPCNLKCCSAISSYPNSINHAKPLTIISLSETSLVQQASLIAP